MKEKSIHFVSSHGDLYVFRDGTIDEERTVYHDPDDPNWLQDIGKVDMEELENYYKLSEVPDKLDCGDVLDFGYWTKGGVYNVPPLRWRLETFHNSAFLKENKIYKILSALRDSIKWIEEKRDVRVDYSKLLGW